MLISGCSSPEAFANGNIGGMGPSVISNLKKSAEISDICSPDLGKIGKARYVQKNTKDLYDPKSLFPFDKFLWDVCGGCTPGRLLGT